MDLSIVMINYNAPELTAQAVESITKTTHQVSYEILWWTILPMGKGIPAWGSPSAGKGVLWNQNKGFGNACNLGAEKRRATSFYF